MRPDRHPSRPASDHQLGGMHRLQPISLVDNDVRRSPHTLCLLLGKLRVTTSGVQVVSSGSSGGNTDSGNSSVRHD